MVLVEELAEDEVQAKEVVSEGGYACETKEAPKEPTLKRGFLDQAAESLYPPEGSPEGVVSAETHKAHNEHDMQKDLNAQMNRGATENNGLERPAWYTKEYPKDCQYNSPGCILDELDTSSHGSDLKKQMVRGMRWEEATARGIASMRLSFMSMCDEDIDDLVKLLKGNTDVTELDLSHNSIKDRGVQTLVGSLANGAAPALRELRIYNNEFGELGQTMLTQGLPVFRKKLQLHWKEPSWAHLAQKPAAPTDASGMD